MNRTYLNCKLLIQRGRYTKEDMYAKLDLFMLIGRITADQYIELTGMIDPPVEEEIFDESVEPEIVNTEDTTEALTEDTAEDSSQDDVE